MKTGELRLTSFFETMLEELNDVKTASQSTDFAVQRLVQRARKRARFHVPALRAKAIDDFIAVNESVKKTQLTLSADIVANAKYYITVALERYTKSVYDEAIQQPLELAYLFDHWRFGPGASNGVVGTHTAQKIQQNMTCTARCEPLVRKLRSLNPYMYLNDKATGSGVSVVSGSRLTTVPKNEDTMRTIAIEPSGNMALQLAAGSYLEGTLRSIGLDISTQQFRNKELARIGSETNGFATIDLKSASDMISIDLVRALMPRDWYDLLTVIRSRSIAVPGYGEIEMNMISTMGNGFTFPLMTLILVSLIYAFRATRGGPNLYIDWSTACVFGDDIILLSSEYEDFCQVLTSAGLIVNYDKSYSDGPFRESCGGDYYEGVDVTPFYVKSLASDPDVYVAMNQVLDWCGKNGIFLFRTLEYLTTLLNGKLLLVPEWHNPNQGLLTALCPRRYKYLSLVSQYRKLTPSIYDMMLAVGGFISESGSDLVFMPRPFRTRYKVRKSRLPQGYLDGGDPRKRAPHVTAHICSFISIMLSC